MAEDRDEKSVKGSVTEAIGKVIADPATAARGERQKRKGRDRRPSTPAMKPREG